MLKINNLYDCSPNPVPKEERKAPKEESIPSFHKLPRLQLASNGTHGVAECYRMTRNGVPTIRFFIDLLPEDREWGRTGDPNKGNRMVTSVRRARGALQRTSS